LHVNRTGDESKVRSPFDVSDDAFAPLADRYLGQFVTLRGIVRAHLVHRQLLEHLPSGPLHIVDVGGGDGREAVELAKLGHQVDLVDPSPDMLARARERLAAAGEDVARRVSLLEASADEVAGLLGGGGHDVVLCHGVIMHLPEPAPLVRALVDLARPGGGLVSLLAKNAVPLAWRPALQGRWSDALAVLDKDRDVGGLGVVTRGDTVESLTGLFAANGAEVLAWYGVRTVTDHLGEIRPPADLADILELEWDVGRRDPYRRMARLIHVFARRRPGVRPG
jgi:SAM-dependent methyltransferase